VGSDLTMVKYLNPASRVCQPISERGQKSLATKDWVAHSSLLLARVGLLRTKPAVLCHPEHLNSPAAS
jgi:hypothetical protein